jgi:DNA repair exonuclease SbcCD ATPase subunit
MRGLHGKCPTCTTELTPERLKSILDPLNTTIQENSEYCTKINEWIINGEKALSELENTSNEINSLKIEFSQYANLPTKESLEKEITEWRASLNALVAPSADSFMVNKEAQIREATSYLNQLKTQDNHPYYLTLVMEYENNKQEERSLQKKILEDQLLIGRLEEQVRVNKESQSKVKELQEKVKQINTQTTLLSVCSEVYGKNGVKTYFIDSVLPLFEFKINSYLQILTKGRITVQLKSQTESKKGDIIEKFELLVLTGDEVLSFENYSGGECKRIAIAVRFALTDLVRMYLGVDTKFLLCDEVSDALDVPGYDALVELLNTLKGEFKHILVISHDVDLQERFSHIVKVTKRDGISSLS